MSEQHTTRRPGILPMLPLSEITKQTVNNVCPGETDVDDFGNEFEVCPENPHGHLFFHGWCLHCENEER